MKCIYMGLLAIVCPFWLLGQCFDPEPMSNMQQLNLMNIPPCWDITEGNKDIPVLVYDRFFDDNHCDLENKIVEIIKPNNNCENFSGSLPNIGVTIDHGLQSLGAIAAIRDNGHCTEGSGGKNTRVAGYCAPADNFPLLQGMNLGYNIISISNWFSTITRATMEELYQNDVVTLVAALNQAHQAYENVPGVIHVGRTRLDGSYWQYNLSNTGPNLNMDILAVTEDLIRLSEFDDCENSGGGTSIGTPYVAGVVAMMRTLNPCMFPEDIEEILVSTSGAIPGNMGANTTRGGIINAEAALLAVENFVPQDFAYPFGIHNIDFQNVSGDLILERNAFVNVNDRLQTGNGSTIIINNSATLNVTGEIRMGQDSRIIVKRGGRLIVDGGLLTNRCSEDWDGIIVEGTYSSQNLGSLVNGTGIVDVMNGATIENARTAISTNAHHIPWQNRLSHYGGLVRISNSHFLNNLRAIEFMPFAGNDASYVISSNFIGHDTAITAWDNYGVVVNNCYFGEFRKNAFFTIDASFVLANSRFDGSDVENPQDAIIEGGYTKSVNHSWVIGDNNNTNNFFGGHIGVSIASPDNSTLFNVGDNIFQCMDTGLEIAGVGKYIVRNNEFYNLSEHGQVYLENGLFENLSFLNYNLNNGIATTAVRENTGLRIFQNCFSSNQRDIINIGVIPTQGEIDGVSASNLFSRPNRVESIGVAGIGVNFDYIINSATPAISRLRPAYGGTQALAIRDDPQDCHAAEWTCIPPAPITPEGGRIVSETSLNEEIETYNRTSVLNQLNLLQSEINLLEATQMVESPEEEAYFTVRKLLSERNTLLQLSVQQESQNNEFGFLTTNILPFGFDAYRFLLGAYMQQWKLTEARALLETMIGSSEPEEDFIYVQGINLDRLMNEDYSVSETTLDQLKFIANKHHPLGGKARAVYLALTGDRIVGEQFSYEHIQNQLALRESKKSDKLFISPNPTRNIINIESDLNLTRYTISTISGEQLVNKSMDNVYEINLAQIKPGIYFLSLFGESNDLVSVEKVIKID